MERVANQDHLLILADAIEALETIQDGTIDLIFIDPPYNIGKPFNRNNGVSETHSHMDSITDTWVSNKEYIDWCKIWLDLCIRKLKPSGSMYIMSSTQSMPYIDIYLRDRIEILSRVVWIYDSSGVQAKKYYGSLYEPILHCVKDSKKYTFNADQILIEAKTGAKRQLIDYRGSEPKPYNTEKVPGNVWEFPRVRYRMKEYEDHPSQKPIALLERIVKASSNPGDLVLDPFSGTFTTSYVAKKLGRRSIGIEINTEYFKIGIRRMGISDSFRGEVLLVPDKSFNRKPKPAIAESQPVLLGEA